MQRYPALSRQGSCSAQSSSPKEVPAVYLKLWVPLQPIPKEEAHVECRSPRQDRCSPKGKLGEGEEDMVGESDPGTSPQAEVARAFGPLLWETQRGLGSTQIPCGNDKRDGGSGAVGAGNLG
jgi:hypothetical protein